MSNHTPGPWFVGGVRQKLAGQQALGIFRFNAEGNRDENIASVWYDPRDGAGTPDARLIAAAPDLLEALKAMLPEANAEEQHCRPSFETCEKARAAIAKAEGRS